MMPDPFRRLKPLYGKRIDDLWLAYELGDSEERRRIEELLMVLAVKRLGIAIGDERIVLEPPPSGLIGKGEYAVGDVIYPGLAPYPFTLHRQDLLRHMFILGPSGTGKSTLIINLLRQFLRDGLAFSCIDFKRNYRCLLKDENASALLVFTVGRNTAPLRLNVLAAPPGVQPTQYVELLADAISSAYLLLHGARNVLKAALLSAIGAKGNQATLVDARDFAASELARARGGSRRYGWLESTHRALDELGKLSDDICATNPISFEELLSRPTVFEVQALGDDQRKFFSLVLLQMILLLRKHQEDKREVLRHVLVFDEAHNVFPKDKWGELSVPSRLAREIREYGEGIIAATQQADVADSLVANSGIKCFLRLDYPKDLDLASRILQIEGRWLTKLPLGHSIARLAMRYYQPFLFNFGESTLKNQLVLDVQIRERYTQWSGSIRKDLTGVLQAESGSPHEISERERSLLADIASKPISTVTERYERLGWNPKTGNAVKNRLIAAGMAAFVVLDIPRSHVKLLTLTDVGQQYASEHNIAVVSRGRAGLEHEFWRARIRERCEARGYTVTAEYSVGDGRVDLHATNGERALLIEIETGHSDVRRNIEKCKDRPEHLVVFFTSDAAQRGAEQALLPTVCVVTPATISRLHDLLNGFTARNARAS